MHRRTVKRDATAYFHFVYIRPRSQNSHTLVNHHLTPELAEAVFTQRNIILKYNAAPRLSRAIMAYSFPQ